MKIDRVYIACHAKGMHLTHCCVASIRHWYPQLPISLIKDELGGPFDTSDLETYWHVDVLNTRRKRFGWGMSKFEALTLTGRQRCLILDNDIVFLGRIVDRLERFNEDFVVACHSGPPEQFDAHYFDRRLLKQIDPQFEYAGGAFNTGQLVATTGILQPDDLATFLIQEEPQAVVRADVFKAAEQGLLNYLLLKRWQQGAISLRHDEFMWWSEWLEPGHVAVGDLERRRDFSVLLHWAGPKPATLAAMRHPEILTFFDDLFWSRIPKHKRTQANEKAMDNGDARSSRLRTAALRIMRERKGRPLV